MRTIKIVLTDAEYASLMQKANYVREDCKKHVRKGYFAPAKSVLPMWAKLNLLRNADKLAKAVKIK